MQRRRSRRADTDVFVNCPFDDEYELGERYEIFKKAV